MTVKEGRKEGGKGRKRTDGYGGKERRKEEKERKRTDGYGEKERRKGKKGRKRTDGELEHLAQVPGHCAVDDAEHLLRQKEVGLEHVATPAVVKETAVVQLHRLPARLVVQGHWWRGEKNNTWLGFG